MSEPSPEVKQAAEKIHARALTLVKGWEPQIAEAIIQQAIDAATAKLREELEQLQSTRDHQQPSAPSLNFPTIRRELDDLIIQGKQPSATTPEDVCGACGNPTPIGTKCDKCFLATPDVEKLAREAAERIANYFGDVQPSELLGIYKNIQQTLVQARAPLVKVLEEIGEDKIRQGDAIWMRDVARAALTGAEEER